MTDVACASYKPVVSYNTRNLLLTIPLALEAQVKFAVRTELNNMKMHAICKCNEN